MRSLRDKLRKLFDGGGGDDLKGERRIKLSFTRNHNHNTGICDASTDPLAMMNLVTRGNADPAMIDQGRCDFSTIFITLISRILRSERYGLELRTEVIFCYN